MNRDQALTILGFDVSSLPTKREVKSAWKSKASTEHPDHGGSDDTMAKINAAYKLLSSDAPENRRCEYCAGTGRVSQSSGIYSIKLNCEICGGTGYVE